MKQEHSHSEPTTITRRGFLRTTSTAVASTAILGSLTVERAAHAAGDDTLKLALIGCGGRGSGAANQALSTKGNVKLVAMADAFEDRLLGSLNELKAAQKDRVDVPDDCRFVGFDAYKQAIALADVVILATPPGFRPSHFEEAVKQGKHVFMEKPVATDAPGVRQVLAVGEAAKQKNLKVVVGLQRHYDNCYRETIKRIHDGAIGDIVAARCYWNTRGVWVNPREVLEKQAGRKLSEMEYQMRNWYYFVWACGDHIVEQHVHNIDVINWVKQSYPVRCWGIGGHEVRRGKDYGEIFDHHVVEFEYEDRSRMFSQCRHIPGCWNIEKEFATGTKGEAYVTDGILLGEGLKRLYRFSRGEANNAYQTEHDELFDAIRNDKPLNDAENGAKSTMTGIMGRMATYSGQPIAWDEAIESEINLMPETLNWEAVAKSVADPKKLLLPDADGLYPVPIPGQTKTV